MSGPPYDRRLEGRDGETLPARVTGPAPPCRSSAVNSRNTTIALVLGAGLLGLGLARMPTSREGAVDNRPLLLHSSLGVTSAILFVIDPTTSNLAAYEAIPGENGGLRLLGARKIEHDLELKKYHDRSEYSYDDLKERKQKDAANKGVEEKAPANGDK
jgi:hypothetical protein